MLTRGSAHGMLVPAPYPAVPEQGAGLALWEGGERRARTQHGSPVNVLAQQDSTAQGPHMGGAREGAAPSLGVGTWCLAS